MDPDRIAARFAACQLAKEEWTHQAHLTVGLWYVKEYGAEMALTKLRIGIRQLNDAHGTPNTDTSGYHETITRAYVELLAQFIATLPDRESPSTHALRQLLDGAVGQRDALFVFYSRSRLLSVDARRGWVEPDIRPLQLGSLDCLGAQ